MRELNSRLHVLCRDRTRVSVSFADHNGNWAWQENCYISRVHPLGEVIFGGFRSKFTLVIELKSCEAVVRTPLVWPKRKRYERYLHQLQLKWPSTEISVSVFDDRFSGEELLADQLSRLPGPGQLHT